MKTSEIVHAVLDRSCFSTIVTYTVLIDNQVLGDFGSGRSLDGGTVWNPHARHASLGFGEEKCIFQLAIADSVAPWQQQGRLVLRFDLLLQCINAAPELLELPL